MNNSRKVFLYIAMSLDGYIARQDDGLGWLSTVQISGEDYGYNDFIKTVDTVIVGRRTYDVVLSLGVPFPHTDKECYIITRSERPRNGSLIFYNGSLQHLVVALKKKKGGNIFVDGGAQIVNELMRHALIDEYIISIIPVMLGDGIRLFNGSRPEEKLTLVGCKSFPSGLIQMHYKQLH